MTPKEKAKELIENFYNILKCYKLAKKCALFAVNEILKETSLGLILIDWWELVKKEIENYEN
jgi:hypothetical protein